MAQIGMSFLLGFLLVQTAAAAASHFSDDDELGTANWLSDLNLGDLAKYLTSSSKVYTLGLNVDHETPAFGTRQCPMITYEVTLNELTFYDDLFLPCWVGMGSQLDGLGHIGTNGTYYKGRKSADMIQSGTVSNLDNGAVPQLGVLPSTLGYSYLTKLNLDNVPPFITRVIVLDMVALFEANDASSVKGAAGQRYLKSGTVVSAANVTAALQRQSLTVRRADVVLIYTGWVKAFGVEPNSLWIGQEPGIDNSAANLLIQSEVLAVGVDQWGVEVIPNVDPGVFPVHQTLIPTSGTYILENMDTSAMVADGVYEALFILSWAKHKGATQAMINPVAISASGGSLTTVTNFPAGDELGTANYLSGVDKANFAKFFTSDSKIYSLGVPITPTDPAFGTRQCVMLTKEVTLQELTFFDDLFLPCWAGIGSQLDGLGHIGINGVYYNSNRGEDMLTNGTVTNLANGAVPELNVLPSNLEYSYLSKLNLDTVPPFVTRAVVLDMVALWQAQGPASNLTTNSGKTYLKPGTVISETHVQAALTRQSLTLGRGDVALIYTGWSQAFGVETNAAWIGGEPGIDLTAARYLVNQKVLAVGADNWGVEVIPAVDSGTFPVHQHLIPTSGTYILENMDTSRMVTDKVYEAFFSLSFGKYLGATQAMINPITVGVPPKTSTEVSACPPQAKAWWGLASKTVVFSVILALMM